MGHVSYTELRQNLSRYMDEAIDSRVPIVVTRQGGKGNVVLLSEEEFNGWQETVHLLKSPANASRLLRSIRSAEAGQTQERDLVAPNPNPDACP
jgi:antitoxin YefM